MNGKEDPRHQMWCKLIASYTNLPKNAKKKARLNFAKERGLMPGDITSYTLDGVVVIDIVPVTSSPKKGNNMYYDDDDMPCVTALTPETAQRDYLRGRLSQIERNKNTEARDFFRIDAMPQPRTPKELAERLTKGLYVVPHANDPEAGTREYGYSFATQQISWRDPAKPADKAGYEAWYAKMDAAARETLDAIVIQTPTDALAAVQKFEQFAVA